MNDFKTPLNPGWHKEDHESGQNYWILEDCGREFQVLKLLTKTYHVLVTNPFTVEADFKIPANSDGGVLAMVERLFPELQIQWAWPCPDIIPDAFKDNVTNHRLTPTVAVESGKIVLFEFIDDYSVLHIKGRTGVVIYNFTTPLASLALGSKVKTGDFIGLRCHPKNTLWNHYPTDGGVQEILGVSGLDFDAEPYLRAAFSRVSHHFHKSLKEIPTSLKDRKKVVEWIQSHKLFTHECSIKRPPEGESKFEKVKGSKDGIELFNMKFDGPGWVEETFRDGGLQDCTHFDFVHECPWSGCALEDESLNTQFHVWVESGGWYDMSLEDMDSEPSEGWNQYNKWNSSIHLDLCTGGRDMEEALLHLAQRVEFYYGEEDKAKPDAQTECEMIEIKGDFISPCEDDGSGYCKECGHMIHHSWYEPEKD